MARNVGSLLTKALSDAESARSDLRGARGKLRRYRGASAKSRARKEIASAEKRLNSAVNRVDKYAGVAAREVEAEEKLERKAIASGDSAKEWEVGFSYEGSRRMGNSVMVNFRIARTDGDRITKKEIRSVVNRLHSGDRSDYVEDDGYEIEGVNWRRPGWRNSRGGRTHDLDSFSAIMQTVFLEDFRLSPVKE